MESATLLGSLNALPQMRHLPAAARSASKRSATSWSALGAPVPGCLGLLERAPFHGFT